jgi:hypothetical protein
MKYTSALLTSASGKLGGAVASKSRGGVKYFRALVFPSQPRTSFQTTIRAIMSSLAAAWASTLTGTQRTSWAALSHDDESGIDTYCRANAVRVQGGLAAIDTPAASVTLPAAPILSIVADASAHTLTIDTAIAGANQMNIYIARKQHASRFARQFPFQLAGTMDDSTTIFTITAAMNGFDVVAGDILYVKLVQYATATPQVAQEQIFRLTVVA